MSVPRFILVWFQLIGFVILAQGFGGCASAPKPRELSQGEIIRRQRILGNELADHFEASLRLKRDSAISAYLSQVSGRLADGNPQLKDALAGIWFISDKKKKWQSYALPGNRLYLSIGALQVLSFENELAAVIALQFGHLVKGHVLERFSQQSDRARDLAERILKAPGFSLDENAVKSPHSPKEYFGQISYFGTNGIFSFTDEMNRTAISEAVDILYRSGYDPRGIVSILEKYKKYPKHSPYDADTAEELVEFARRRVAALAPLRNPIVRSEKFLMIQKRINRL